MARPTKYNSKIHPEIAKNLAKKHFIDSVIADMLGISAPTFIEWKKKYPEFNDALRQGKDEVDGQVISALYENTQPSEVEEVTTIDDGEKTVIRTKRYRKKGNVGAQKLWLTNRRPDEWRETQHIEQGVEGDLKDVLEGIFSKKDIKIDLNVTSKDKNEDDDIKEEKE